MHQVSRITLQRRSKIGVLTFLVLIFFFGEVGGVIFFFNSYFSSRNWRAGKELTWPSTNYYRRVKVAAPWTSQKHRKCWGSESVVVKSMEWVGSWKQLNWETQSRGLNLLQLCEFGWRKGCPHLQSGCSVGLLGGAWSLLQRCEVGRSSLYLLCLTWKPCKAYSDS